MILNCIPSTKPIFTLEQFFQLKDRCLLGNLTSNDSVLSINSIFEQHTGASLSTFPEDLDRPCKVILNKAEPRKKVFYVQSDRNMSVFRDFDVKIDSKIFRLRQIFENLSNGLNHIDTNNIFTLLIALGMSTD